jgi:hypothetical protein
MKTLTEIKTEVDSLAAIIGAEGQYSLPTYGYSEDGARPHVEVDSRGYHLVVEDRGREQSRLTTQDVDELLFHIFKSTAFTLAGDYESRHRIEGQDSRRLLFQRQVELLSRLSSRWAEREAEEQRRVLAEYPFDDDSLTRAELSRGLREAGYDPQTAWRMACERYPLPGPHHS